MSEKHEKHIVSRQREVNPMLDFVKQETEGIESRFHEPACGTDNFLAEILERNLLTEDEIAFIESMVRPMPAGDAAANGA